MMNNRAKPIVLFVYGNEPSPPRLERMRLLQHSGKYEVYMVYWARRNSPISFPFSSDLPTERFIPIRLPDPRGNFIRRLILTLRFAKRVSNVIRRLEPSAVHTFYPDMLLVARLTLLRRNATALLYEIPDINEGTIAPWARWLLRLLFKRADAILIHSDQFQPAYLDRYHLVNASKPVVYSSVSPSHSFFAGFTTRKAEDLVVGYIGNFRGERQITNLVQATKAVRESGRNVRLLFAGAGKDSSMVQTLAKEYPFMEVQGPFDYWTDILGLYQRIDIIFAVYPQEILNYRVHVARRFSEGIVCNLPVIVAKGSYMGKISETEGFGWTVGHDSQEDLNLLLTRVYDNRAELVARGQVSDSLRRHHSLEHHAPGILEVYSKVTNARAPAPMTQLLLKGDPYQIADSLFRSVLENECVRDDILEPEQSARMRYYYRQLLDPKRRAFSRHHSSQRLAYVMEQMGTAGPEVNVLDVACGIGTQSILYAIMGYSVTAIDINSQDIAIAKRRTQFYSHLLGRPLNINYMVASATDYTLGDSRPYDVVIVQEAISHIHPAESFLDNVGNLMAPEGLLIVSDTNALNPLVRLKLFREVGTWDYLVREETDEITGEVRPYAYKRVFSVPSMGRMLRARGFKRRNTRGSGFIPPMVARSTPLFSAVKWVERLLYILPGHSLVGTSYTLVVQKRQPGD